MRHFCGFCGTPLSFWSEQPRSEADFIQLTLGSLSAEDLGDLEDLGLLPGSDDEAETPPSPVRPADSAGLSATGADNTTGEVALRPGRETLGGIPWFDSLVEGSRLGRLSRRKGSSRSPDGTVKVEWEVVEYTEDDSGADTPRSGKRKFGDEEEDHKEPMLGVEQ